MIWFCGLKNMMNMFCWALKMGWWSAKWQASSSGQLSGQPVVVLSIFLGLLLGQMTISGDILCLYPIGSMYGIYANIGGILMVNVTIYSIHGSYVYICRFSDIIPRSPSNITVSNRFPKLIMTFNGSRILPDTPNSTDILTTTTIDIGH